MLLLSPLIFSFFRCFRFFADAFYFRFSLFHVDAAFSDYAAAALSYADYVFFFFFAISI